MLLRIGAGIRDNPLSIRRGETTATAAALEVVGLLSDDVDTLELRFERDLSDKPLLLAFSVLQLSVVSAKFPLLLTQVVVKSSKSLVVFVFDA